MSVITANRLAASPARNGSRPRRRPRVAVVGIGARATWALSACQQEDAALEVAAIVDPIAWRLSLAQEEYRLHGVPGYQSLAQCLREVECDAVAVFTPDAMHAEPAVEALEAGKHVFLEKPLDVTRDRMRRIIDADDAAGGRTFVGLNLRFAPVYRRIRALIQDGTVGEVLTVQADEFYQGGRTYFRRWNRLRRHGGGLWITKSCHDFDLLQWLVPSRPVAISAASSLSYYRPKPEAAMHCRDCSLAPECKDRYDLFVTPESVGHRLNLAMERETGQKADLCLFNSDKDTFDHGTAMIRFESGASAAYTVNVVAPFGNRRIRVSGTLATIDGDLERMEVSVYPRDGGPPRTENVSAAGDGLHGGADGHLLKAFAAFVRGESDAAVRPRDAAVGVLMGLAAEASTHSGRAEPLVLLD